MKLIQHLGGASVLMATLLAGCSLAPTYERPDLPVQTQWPDKVAPGASDAVAASCRNRRPDCSSW